VVIKEKINIKILKVGRYMCERRKVKRRKVVKDGESRKGMNNSLV
jgi:hypothetical protein